MPSPVGHSVIGLSLGLAYWLKPSPSWHRLWLSLWRQRWPIVGAVALANLPDVDYVPGVLSGNINAYHHFYTHTLGWIVIVAAGWWMCGRAFGKKASWRHALFVVVLLVSHLVADLFSADGSEPYGLMALWPLSDTYFISSTSLYFGLKKATWSEVFQWINVKFVLWEALLTSPLLIAVILYKRFKQRMPTS